MTVEYELTKDDLREFNLYHSRESPTARRQYLRAWLIPSFLLFLLFLLVWASAVSRNGEPLQKFFDTSPLFIGAVFCFVFYPLFYRRKLKQIVEGMVGEGDSRGLFTRHRLEISPETVSDFTDSVKSTTHWRVVERVAVSKDYAFIYINSMAAFIVPRRAFGDSSQFDDFVRLTSEYHQRAK